MVSPFQQEHKTQASGSTRQIHTSSLFRFTPRFHIGATHFREISWLPVSPRVESSTATTDFNYWNGILPSSWCLGSQLPHIKNGSFLCGLPSHMMTLKPPHPHLFASPRLKYDNHDKASYIVSSYTQSSSQANLFIRLFASPIGRKNSTPFPRHTEKIF